MLLSYIFRPSVVKYGVLTNSRRSMLHTVIDCLSFGVVADVTVVVFQSTYSLYRVVNRGLFTATRCRNLPWKWRTFWTIVPISCHSTVFPRKLLIVCRCCCCCFCIKSCLTFPDACVTEVTLVTLCLREFLFLNQECGSWNLDRLVLYQLSLHWLIFFVFLFVCL